MTLNEFEAWLKTNKHIHELNIHNLSCTPEGGCMIDEIECELGDPYCEHEHSFRKDTGHGYSQIIMDVQKEWYKKNKDSHDPGPFPTVEESLDEFVRRINFLYDHPSKCEYCSTEIETGMTVLE